MVVKLGHVVIEVKSEEEMKKAKDFFINVIGLHVREGMPADGVEPGTDIWSEISLSYPDRVLHLLDDFGSFVDLVYAKRKPICFARGVGSGKGVAIAFEVPDLKKTWAKLKDYPVQPILYPKPYHDPEHKLKKNPLWCFIALDMGRVSEDGEQQIIQLGESRE
jgi:catechol 2,3-dioxygenase-like lactoylglutathione lyase family enzyme